MGRRKGEEMNTFLVGKTIMGMKIADDKEALLFQTEQGDAVVKTDADCCSSTWIEHVELPARGFPAEVLAVEDLDMPDLGSDNESEIIAYYGCKIITDKGEIIIDYRNSSNGYYGGNLSWPDNDYFCGGVYGQNVSTEKWVNVGEV